MQNKNPSSWVPRIFKEAESLDSNEVTTEVETTKPLVSRGGTAQYEPAGSAGRSIRWARVLTIGVVGTFMLILGAAYLLTHIIDSQKPQSSSTISTTPTSYTVMSLPLNNLVESGQLQVDQNSQVTLNGQLRLNNATVLTPISQPATPVTGEFYYDKTTNQPYYYNGSQYVSMSSPGVVVNSIGGLTGSVELGPGLEINDGEIAATPTAASPKSIVTSLQGESGTVLLASGEGINIYGTTISNGGVTSFGGATGALSVGTGLSVTGDTISSTVGITSASSDLIVTPDGSGNFILSLSGSGVSGTVSLGPAAAQVDDSTNPSIFINKTGVADLLEMQFDGTDQFVVNSSGQITTGTIPYSSVTNTPSIVNSIGGQSGALVLGGGLTITGNILANSGVTNIGGTANQVNVSATVGNVTISLPQSIGVTASPTFAGLTLSTTPLAVTSGGTGSSTASGARTNLGAAASGANSDITSLTTVTAVNDGSSNITVGSTGGILTLQGSASSTIVAGSGANTTSLNFATLSGNNTITFPASSGTVCTTIGNCLGAGGGANAALSNLSSVAINTSLLPGTTTIDLGSATAPFNNLYLGGSTSNNFELTGTATGGTQVLTLPNASGTVCLENSVSCGFASSGSGVSSITGTANQVNASSSTGAITLSLPQSIGTSSTPTFGGLTLGSALTVTNGGTGAITASGARTNLGAAASGANSDITSLTTVTAVNDGAATITVGSTGGVLTLQGSSGSTFTVGSGANTTSLNFATLSGNNTITFPASTGTVCTTSNNCLGGGAGGASVSLSNLSGVAINTSLLPGTTTIDLGSATAPFNNLYLGGSTSNNFELTGTATGGTQVLTLPNATGTICLENSVSCGFGSSGAGVTSITGTANQVIASASTGSITLSLPQDIATTSTPSFAGLTLSTTPLAVTSGGTGSSTASGARTNLGAAASGANSDITSLTTVTAVNDGSSNITVGSTGGILTLQGSASSTIVAGSGANTTSLNFATLSGNNTITFPASSGTVCTTIGNCLGAGGGANAALSNLSSVAINTSLLPGTTTIDLGSATAPFNNLYLGGSTSNNFELTGTATGGTQVLTLPNASGTVCLENSVSCGFASSGSGVSSITGTANQVNASSSTGAITLSLPQSIGTSSTPTFGGLTLGSALTVTNGGTGAITASGARTNLGAAASGANSDITSLTTVTAVNDGAATITVGSTGGVLTLQGSSGSTFTVGSGANTTSLNFATLSGNNTITFPASTGTVCTTSNNCLGGGAGGASVSLSNLSGVAINTSLLPGTTTIDLGSATAPFNNLYLGGSTSNNFELTGTATGGTQVLTLPNATGTICLENSVSCGFGSSGAGVTSITGTANQVIASASTGSITLSLPQDIATTSTPSFAGLTLSTTPLAVTSGGTGSSTASGARTNLGAAASGANSDITSLTTVTAVNDGSSNITVGSTGGILTLQGSASSTIVAGSGANTTSLNFATLSGNNTITFPASSGTVCLQSSTSCGFVTGSGSAIVQNGNSFGATVTIGSNDANGVNIRTDGTTVESLSSTGAATFKNTSNSTTAFQIQNAAGTNVLNTDTANAQVDIGAIPAPGTLMLTQAPLVGTATGTAGSTNYTYEITAVSSNGAESLGASESANSFSSNIVTNPITLNWTTNGSAYYKIYRIASAGTPSSLGLIGTSTTGTFIDTGFTAGNTAPALATSGSMTVSSTYYYKVTALDDSYTTGSNIGESPASTQLTAATNAANKSLTISWAPVAGARAYNVYRTTTSGNYTTDSYYTVYTNSFTDTLGTATGTNTVSPTTGTAYSNTLSDNTSSDVSIGGNGTATSQLYVGGAVPTVAIGSVATTSQPFSTYIQGNYAYVASSGSATLQIFDISNPTNPVLVGTFTNSSDLYGVSVQGHYAYITDVGVHELVVVDVSNPSDPVLVGSALTDALPYSLYVSGRYAYVANFAGDTLQIFDISDPTNPVNVGTVATGSGPQSVFVSGSYAYVTNEGSGSDTLQVINISDPTNPVSVGTAATGSNPYDVYVQGSYAYVVNRGSNSIQIFNITNPADPISVGKATTGTNPQSVYVSGRYAYVTNWLGYTLQIFDVSNPADPAAVGNPVPTGVDPESLTVSGRYAYVTNEDSNTLQIFDLGGAYVQQLQAGGVEVSTLSVDDNAVVSGDESITGGLTVGNSAQISGSLGVGGDLCVNATSCTAGEALGVEGTIIATGSITGSGSPDYAEDITASDPTIEAGDLVSMDLTNPGQAVKSSGAYDPNLIGAISTSPGYLTNAPAGAINGTPATTDQVPLGLVGRIPVNVDTENGPVAIGDYITSSSTPGVGMVATAPGQVVGRAMTSYSGSGVGTVTVYLEHFFYNPTTPSGSDTLSSLTVSGQTDLQVLTVESNANIIGNLTVSGSTTVGNITVNGHIISGGSTPNVSVLSNAGSSATVTVAGDDSIGTVTLTSGSSGIVSGSQVNLTFASSYSGTPHVLITPNDSNSASLEVYPTNVTNTGFTLNVSSLPQANTTYSFEYLVVQ